MKTEVAESTSVCCPCCGKPFDVDNHNGSVFVWCGYGPCRSDAANLGKYGVDYADAARKLITFIEAAEL